MAGAKKGWYLPFPNPKQAAQRLAHQVEQVKKVLSVPVILENMSPLPEPHSRSGYIAETDSRLLSQVVDVTGSGLLLDKVQQVYVSGPR
jgi:uncharacterized protein (UPF0276 family)